MQKREVVLEIAKHSKVERVLRLTTYLFLILLLNVVAGSLVSDQLCKVRWQCRPKRQRGRKKKQGGTEVKCKLGLVSQAFFSEVSDIRHQDRRRRHHCTA